MTKYIAKRVLMMIPTLLGITVISFFIINLAPGSPIEKKIQEIRFSGGGEGDGGGASHYGVSQEVIEELKKQYGFDKPIYIRYLIWLKRIVTLDFGESFSYEAPVLEVIVSKLPVSIQFGLASFILVYLICIPLGIMMAVYDGTRFDVIASGILFVLYSIMPVVLAILLITFFAGGSFFDIFPIGDLYSDEYEFLSVGGKILDRVHHFILPLTCYMIGQFTVLSMLMKNSLLSEIRQDYVRTARAKGLSEKIVIYKHTLRNALIPIVTGFGSFLGFFLAGSLIIELVFNLDGLGLLSYKSVLDRDYNVMMAMLFIVSVVSLLGRLISDLLYVVVDPRIHYN